MNPFFKFGKTSSGLPIPAYQFGEQGLHVLILGGVHGDEPEGVVAAHGLLDLFTQSYDFKLKLTLVPTFNVEGVLAKTRVNGRGVDLNRNLPTRDWNPKAFNERYPPGPFANSEPENQALTAFLEKTDPKFIISLHSWKPLLNINGNCREEAEAIHSLTGYTIEESIGYPTPGCLGTYSGLERNMPTLTYEVERGSSVQKILEIHPPAILKALRVVEKKYL